MSAKISTPSNQKLLTNVTLVRMKKGGTRFELACYPNKVQVWRDGIEKDLSEVLQVEQVFINVSKGRLPNKKQLEKAFPKMKLNQIILEVRRQQFFFFFFFSNFFLIFSLSFLQILKKGDLQVTQAERKKNAASMLRDIATIVAEKCVNSETQRPFTRGVIEKAIKDAHYSIHPTRSAKQQALSVIQLLKESIPIERAQMRLHVTIPKKLASKCKERVKALLTVELEEFNRDFELTGLMDPGSFRQLEELVRSETKGAGRVDVVDFSVIKEGKGKLSTAAPAASSSTEKPQRELYIAKPKPRAKQTTNDEQE